MTEAQKGVLGLVLTCTIWGLSGIYYKLLDHVPPHEVLVHRTIWSLVAFAGLLAVQGRLSHLRRAFQDRRQVGRILLCGALISINWFVFITSIQVGRATEASLGYYIFPLVAVLLGALVLGEALSRVQTMAILLAGLAVGLLTWGLGVAPWIALILSSTFGFYGLLKKQMTLGPVLSVTAEVLVLLPVALVVLAWLHLGPGGSFGQNWRDSLLLAFSGGLTATPLVLFSQAAKRVSLATVGIVQFLNPTLQFLVATLWFLEPLSRWHLVAFALIWSAVALYSGSAWRQDKAARKASANAAGVSTERTKSRIDLSAKP